MSVLKEPILKLSQSARMKNFVTHNKIGRSAARRFVAGEQLEEAVDATKVLNTQSIQVALVILSLFQSKNLEWGYVQTN